jgi:adenosylcobinamide-GDP ribazoletransferase
VTVLDGLRLSVALLTRWPLPVDRVDRRTAGAAMACAPLVGVALGAVAGGVAVGVHAAVGGVVGALLGAALAVAVLTALTGALHLDGWADVADALGVRGDAAAARAVAKSPSVGAFGVVAIVLAVVVDVAAVGACVQQGRAMTSLVAGAATGRLAATWAAYRLLPAAPDGLGAWVAQSVSLVQAIAASLVVAAICAAAGGVPALGAAAVGLTAGLVVCRIGVRRFGGITGDVFGAAITGAATMTYVVLALTVKLAN